MKHYFIELSGLIKIKSLKTPITLINHGFISLKSKIQNLKSKIK